MRVLVAPGAFKGSMSAAEAAHRLGRDVLAAHPQADLVYLPMADGGDDTVDVLCRHGWHVTGLPSGAEVAVRHEVVVVELARLCGMRTLMRPDPWGASTLALGTALREVAQLTPARVLLALGGSASTDGGLGMLRALAGARTGGGLRDLVDVVAEGKDVNLPRLPYSMTAVVDVLAPLCGPSGAAMAFGPQKGLAADECRLADDVLARWAAMLEVNPEVPGTGAAGGTGAAALALGADLQSGARAIAELIDLDAAVGSADLVVTGEGRLDATTLAGKSPMIVIEAALAAGIPVRCVVGQTDPDVAALLGDRGVDVVILDTSTA